MRSELALFFDDFFARSLLSTADLNYPPVNVYKMDGDVILELAVAGFKQDDLTVEFDGQQLTVSGKKQPSVVEGRKYITRELSSRSFTRSFAISGQYEPQQPVLQDGVLTVVLKGTNIKRTLHIATPPPLLEG